MLRSAWRDAALLPPNGGIVSVSTAPLPRIHDRLSFRTPRALQSGNGIISFQVVQEFLNVATRKFATPLRTDDCLEYVDKVLGPMCEVHSSIALYRDALEIEERWKLSFFDSLIVSAALAADCAILCSEDLQDGQTIRDLTVKNPFREGFGSS